MPIVLGTGAVAFVLLSLLTLITLYWIFTKWHDLVQGLPVIGNGLANVGDYLRDRNLELMRNVVNAASDLISWAEDKVNEGLNFAINLALNGPTAQLIKVIADFGGLQAYVNGWITDQINGLLGTFKTLDTYVHGFITLNINAFNYWKDQTTAFNDQFVRPNITALLALTTVISKVTLPELGNSLIQTAKALANLDTQTVQPMRKELTDFHSSTAIALNDPVVGVVPRTGTLEHDMAQVLPWAGAIGISAVVAANLAKLGRNPCWCTSEGPLQDNGTLELAALMDLI